MMTFEQLYHFTEVYRQRSITHAAVNLYVSRQALSLSVKKLETEFGVTLFTRLANGVEPTKAGKEFYHSAQAILNESAILRQNMLNCSPQKTTMEICRIGVAESIMSAYGSRLCETLSAFFPHTYFDFSLIIVRDEPDFYKNYDLSIVVLTDALLENYSKIENSKYVAKYIATFPIYVWISADSPWNEYSTLSFNMLKNTPYCLLKNSYSGVNFLNYLKNYTNELPTKTPAIELEKNFINHIENFGYYTIDVPLNNTKLFYTDLFKNNNIVLKTTTHSLILEAIYERETCQDFYPIIADILAEG